MPDLHGQLGEVRMTIQITRKATGQVENFDLVGFVDEDQLKQLQDSQKEQNHGG